MSNNTQDKATNNALNALEAARWLATTSQEWQNKAKIMQNTCVTYIEGREHVMLNTLQDNVRRNTPVAKAFREAYEVYEQNKSIINLFK